MTFDLFIASLLFSAAASMGVFLLLRNRRADATATDFDLTAIESRVSDLASELMRVANSHGNAVEERRDELKRVIEMANDRIRRLHSLLSDLEIIEKRIREAAAPFKETVVEDDLVRSAQPAMKDARGRRALHEEILTLAGSGLAPSAIAAELRLPRDEVELVLRRSRREV
jgi:hypothetical protein